MPPLPPEAGEGGGEGLPTEPQPPPDQPLTDPELASLLAALGPYERRPRLAVAVSGGPDSMALALLAARWATEAGGDLLALHVDHGLRPESPAEAARVVAWLAGREVACRILRWEGPKPATGVQAAAREARHALLEAACRAEGVLHLLLAHHADDLAETARMRAEAGSGPAGLAGMAAVRERPGLRLLRPLLRVRRGRLAATLRALGQPWLDDPANASPRHARGRLRADPGHDHAAWFAVAERAAGERAAADRELAAFAAEAVAPDPALGFLAVALGPWRALPAVLREAGLARCVLAVSGSTYPPPTAALARAAAALAAPGPCRLTLGGALLASDGGRRLVVVREAGRIGDRRALAPGERAEGWDGRVDVAYLAGPGPAELAPLLERGRLLLPRAARDALRARGVPPAAVEALPALWRRGLPPACPVHEASGVAAAFRAAPGWSLAPAPFAGVNVV